MKFHPQFFFNNSEEKNTKFSIPKMKLTVINITFYGKVLE